MPLYLYILEILKKIVNFRLNGFFWNPNCILNFLDNVKFHTVSHRELCKGYVNRNQVVFIRHFK